jgi:hypothetical protein
MIALVPVDTESQFGPFPGNTGECRNERGECRQTAFDRLLRTLVWVDVREKA